MDIQTSRFLDLPFDFMTDPVNPHDLGVNVYKERITNLNNDICLMQHKFSIRSTLNTLVTEVRDAEGRISNEGYVTILEKLHESVGEECERALNAAGFKTVSRYSIYPITNAKDKVEILRLWSSSPGLIKNKKQGFLESPIPNSWQVPAKRVEPIARHYETKYSEVVIVKNGCSELGPQLIKERHLELRKKLDDELKPYIDEKTRYMKVAKWGFLKDISGYNLHSDTIGNENYIYLKNMLSSYLDKHDVFKSSLTDNDWQNINELIKQDNQARKIVDDRIAKLVNDEEEKYQLLIDDTTLTRDGTTREIAFLQKSLPQKGLVGYMFTNEKMNTTDHFEVLLISPKLIIKPITWFSTQEKRTLIYQHKSIWAETKLNSPLVLTKGNPKKVPCAQADDGACGTLGTLYLKELMKGGAWQLKNYTLSFPLTGIPGDAWFFFPSPHVLRYSQSSVYNEIFVKMLEEDSETVQVKDFTFYTLKTLLKNSIASATKEDTQALADHCQTLLDNLPAFREKWLRAYNVVKTKREAMKYTGQIPNLTGKNLYLTAATHRLKAIGKSAPMENQKPVAPLAAKHLVD